MNRDDHLNIVDQLNASIQAEEAAIEAENSEEIQKCNVCKNLNELCRICIRRKNIADSRNVAKRKQGENAEKMVAQSNKRFKPAEFGENVNVPIPDVDRGKLDPQNFTAVVTKVDHQNGMYIIYNIT